jgi:hypothetical protein
MKRFLIILRIVTLALILAMALFPVQAAEASADIYVPSPTYPTIQAGIDAAVFGDTVHVAAGIYFERITLQDGVQVVGAGADITTIDGGASASVVTAVGVGAATQLDRFTITNGRTVLGGGMYNQNASPTVTNCIFSGNSVVTVTGSGGGM